MELLSVLAIAAVLCALGAGAGWYAQESGRRARAAGELACLAAALESYRGRHGDYPRTSDPSALLQSLLGKRGPDGAQAEGPAQIDLTSFCTVDGRDPGTDATAQLSDPWRRAYRYAYRQPAAGWTNPSFVLWSAGPDGETQSQLTPGGYPANAAPGAADDLHALP